MRSKKNFLSLGIIALVLFLGVGYAVVSSVYLNIGGTASVSDSELKVEITNAVASTTVAEKTVDFNHTLSNDKLSSNFTLNGMELNETVSITYTVTNNETDVDAVLTGTDVDLTNSNSDFFDVDYEITDAETDLENDDKTMTVLVKVSLVQTPVTEDEGTTTVGLTLTASPKGGNSGSISNVLPLKFGQNYYLVSLMNVDIKNMGLWYKFYSDGSLVQNDNLMFPEDGYVYSRDRITNPNYGDGSFFTISSDGTYITFIGTDSSVSGMLVFESEYNNIKDLIFKFGEKYYCTTDNYSTDLENCYGDYMLGYPDGSGQFYNFKENSDFVPAGTNTYTDTEIYTTAFSDGIKLLISDNGNTISQVYNDKVYYVYTIRSEELPRWSTSEVVNNTSAIIDNSVINDLPQENPKFVNITNNVPHISYLLDTKMKYEVDGERYYLSLDFDYIEDNGAYLLKYANDSIYTYIIVVPGVGEYFKTTFTEPGIYAFDYTSYDSNDEFIFQLQYNGD